MTRGGIFLSVLLLISTGVFAKKPKWVWKESGTQTVEFTALEGKAFRLPHAAAMKIVIEADSAVFGGVIPMQKIREYEQAHRPLRKPDFQRTPCEMVDVVKGETACRLDGLGYDAMFVVRDKRAEGTQALAILGAARANAELAQRATKPNQVKITIFLPQCVENCLTD